MYSLWLQNKPCIFSKDWKCCVIFVVSMMSLHAKHSVITIWINLFFPWHFGQSGFETIVCDSQPSHLGHHRHKSHQTCMQSFCPIVHMSCCFLRLFKNCTNCIAAKPVETDATTSTIYCRWCPGSSDSPLPEQSSGFFTGGAKLGQHDWFCASWNKSHCWRLRAETSGRMSEQVTASITRHQSTCATSHMR